MKHTIALSIATMLFLAVPNKGNAGELTPDSIQGDWVFTHILMDGGREMKVNGPTEFLTDGTVIFYLTPGIERDRGTYEINDDSIIYNDKKGKQVWKLVSFDGDTLHVDHKGAEMFFERQ